jgi:hypothetical protein
MNLGIVKIIALSANEKLLSCWQQLAKVIIFSQLSVLHFYAAENLNCISILDD